MTISPLRAAVSILHWFSANSAIVLRADVVIGPYNWRWNEKEV